MTEKIYYTFLSTIKCGLYEFKDSVFFPTLSPVSTHNRCSLKFAVSYVKRKGVRGWGSGVGKRLLFHHLSSIPQSGEAPISLNSHLPTMHSDLWPPQPTYLSRTHRCGNSLCFLTALPLNSHSSSLNHWLQPLCWECTYFFLWIYLVLFVSISRAI